MTNKKIKEVLQQAFQEYQIKWALQPDVSNNSMVAIAEVYSKLFNCTWLEAEEILFKGLKK